MKIHYYLYHTQQYYELITIITNQLRARLNTSFKIFVLYFKGKIIRFLNSQLNLIRLTKILKIYLQRHFVYRLCFKLSSSSITFVIYRNSHQLKRIFSYSYLYVCMFKLKNVILNINSGIQPLREI